MIWALSYTAFEINLLMSMLFIHMLLSRNDVRGQSIYVAIAKMIGNDWDSLCFSSCLSVSSIINPAEFPLFSDPAI
jgi:hypothetical protein